MEGILNNGLNYIPKTIQTLKELISYFWQPSMSRDYTRQNQNAESNDKNLELPLCLFKTTKKGFSNTIENTIP